MGPHAAGSKIAVSPHFSISAVSDSIREVAKQAGLSSLTAMRIRKACKQLCFLRARREQFARDVPSGWKA
jgi:hypothetical protein